jgi:hypothetical protein
MIYFLISPSKPPHQTRDMNSLLDSFPYSLHEPNKISPLIPMPLFHVVAKHTLERREGMWKVKKMVGKIKLYNRHEMVVHRGL